VAGKGVKTENVLWKKEPKHRLKGIFCLFFRLSVIRYRMGLVTRGRAGLSAEQSGESIPLLSPVKVRLSAEISFLFITN